MARSFQGKIELDIRDSTPDWSPYLADEAPEGAPNVLIVLYDDTGLAAWSPFGGRIEMPTMDRLAGDGLTYSQWHTTALCGPTRSCFLTGRNHHQNSFATIAETATGFPGNNTHIPMENAFQAEVMRENGWATYWIGKNHNVPVDEFDMGSSKRNWPLARGFDRFYGFIGGGRRDQPVVSKPGRGQPLHRSAVPARGGLPPLQGPGRPRARDDPHRQGQPAGQALVHALLPGRQPRPPPCAAGVHRQVQGRLRRRLRGLSRVGAAADGRARDPPRGHRAHADEPDVAGRRRIPPTPCGRGTRSPTTRSGCSRGWPRSTPASRSTPTTRWAGSSTTSSSRGSSTTR
jgi:Sulfatase